MSTEITRQCELIPKNLNIRFGNNSLSVHYQIQDNLTKSLIGDTYVNFTPSKKLMRLLSVEITDAIQNKK